MRAFVRFRTPSGEVHDLSHGDIIGRLWSAAMHIDDARVSEAHAMVSLRGRELRLLALRGLFALDSQPINSLTLQPGQRIALARGVEIVVLDVVLPDVVLAVEGDDLPRQVLSGVCSLLPAPQPQLLPGYREGGAILWSTGDRWRLQLPDEPPQDLDIGDTWTLGGRRFRAVSVNLAVAGQDATRAQGSVREPLRIVTFYDTVHIHRDGQPVFLLSGIAARLISALAAVEVPISWEAVAQEVWGDQDRNDLRRRWDVAVARLRKKLQLAGIRPDLIRADGCGNFELLRYPDDVLDDQS